MFVLTKNQAKAKADVLTKFLAERGVTLPASDMLNAIARMAGREDWNALAATYRPEAVDASLQDLEMQHARDSLDPDQTNGGFGPECQIQTASGFWLVMPGDDGPVDYVRICDPLGREVVYWSDDEFTADAGCVLGALAGALNRSRSDVMPNPLKPSADKLVVTDRSGKNQLPKLRSNLGDLPWSEITTLRICPSGQHERDGKYYSLHNPEEIDFDIFALIDAERNGQLNEGDEGQLNDLSSQVQIDWGDEYELEGLTVQELRNAVAGPGRAWTLSDGRVLRFYRPEAV